MDWKCRPIALNVVLETRERVRERERVVSKKNRSFVLVDGFCVFRLELHAWSSTHGKRLNFSISFSSSRSGSPVFHITVFSLLFFWEAAYFGSLFSSSHQINLIYAKLDKYFTRRAYFPQTLTHKQKHIEYLRRWQERKKNARPSQMFAE